MSAMKLGLKSQAPQGAGELSQSNKLPKNKLSNFVGQASHLLDQGGQDAHPTIGNWIFFNLAVSNIDALVQQGRDYYESGQFAQAATVWEQAASSFANRGDGLNQAMVLSNLSLAYQRLGQWPEAKDAIAKSLDLLQSTTDTSSSPIRIFAQALNTQGSLQLAQGQAEQALATWKKAEAAYRQANDDAGILRSQINQAQALKTLGFYRRALTLLTQVYQTLQQQPDSPLKAAGLRSLGSAFLLVGDVEQSRQVLQQSLNVAQNLKLTGDMGATLYDLGNSAKAGQDTNAALEYYQQAAAIATEPLTKIQAQLNQLRLLIETQQWSAARALSSKIQSQLDNLPPSRAAIYAQIDLSMSLLKLSEFNPQSSGQSGTSQ
jgi:tetratricopeptide (TPR) repeat protein